MKAIGDKSLMRQLFLPLSRIILFLIATLSVWEPGHTLLIATCKTSQHHSEITPTRRGVFFDIAKTSKTVVSVGEHGQILYSQDEGKTWASAKTPVNQSLTSLFFLNDYLGWAVGHDAVILKTADGGVNWETVQKPSAASPALFSIWFKDPSVGLAVGADSAIYRTVDGAKTWTAQKLANQAHLYSITQTTDGTLWVAGDNQTLYLSHDLGMSWKKMDVALSTSFFGLIPISDKLIAFGLRGHVSAWHNSTLLKNSVESDENLLGAVQLKNGQIVLAGQRGLILIAKVDSWTFRSLKIAPQEDVISLTEVSDALIFVGEFGIVRIAKSDLRL